MRVLVFRKRLKIEHYLKGVHYYDNDYEQNL